MSSTPRRTIAVAAVSLAMAIALVLFALFTVSWLGPSNRFFEPVLAPGIALWKLSNWVCPPYGERCFLLSERQIAHHVWGFICYVAAWWAIFAAVIAGSCALTARLTRTPKFPRIS
jgi:hypothetical protein